MDGGGATGGGEASGGEGGGGGIEVPSVREVEMLEGRAGSW